MTATAMSHDVRVPVARATSSVGQEALLICGILASLLYVAMMQAIGYEGYSATSQTVSELSAIGAPTRRLWSWLGMVYIVLAMAFGWGVWKSAGANRPLRAVGGLLLALGFLGLLWPFAAMHQREVLAAGGATLSDDLHVVLGTVTPVMFLLAIAFGAAAFGRAFRIYSIATLVILLAFGALMGVEAPGVQANLPTPWIGLWERIIIAGYMLWAAVLAIVLLGTRPAPAERSSS